MRGSYRKTNNKNKENDRSCPTICESDWRQASKIASRGETVAPRSDASRSLLMAKSIIMMAFFLTMPISRITPISAMMLKSVPEASSASSAPTPADGSVDRMVSGCT